MRDDGVTKYLLSYFGKRTDDVKTLETYFMKMYVLICTKYDIALFVFACR